MLPFLGIFLGVKRQGDLPSFSLSLLLSRQVSSSILRPFNYIGSSLFMSTQVKGTGLANRCPEVVGEGSIALQGGKTYQLSDLCLEPKTWQVEEEVTNKRGETTKSFVNTKLMTRQTYSLDGVSGDISVGEGGKIKFEEKDGIDYAATTIQLPGGERVPFLFTIKELVATAAQPGNALKPGFQFGGSFKVRESFRC